MDKECTDTGDSFVCNCFEYDGGSYFDMDLTHPCNGNKSLLEGNRESEEFEFSVSVSPSTKPNIKECVDNVSPADDLFYRGLLLPLNLPPRLEMVRNLSSPTEFKGDTDGFDRQSAGFRDSNQRPGCCKESQCGSAETEDKTHFQPIVKSGTKQNPDSPGNGKHVKHVTSTSVKHVLQKCAKLVKHKISSHKHNDAQTGDQQLKMDEGRACPCVADDSGRKNDVGYRRVGSESRKPSMNSSLNFSSDDLQSAIAYCKQSNGGLVRRSI